MNKPKFTPGPWHISNPTFRGKWAGFATYKGECRGIYATNDDLEAIALVPKDYLLAYKDQDYEANATLIAKAPELYEALSELVYLHQCEQEGLSSGQPTPEQWIKAVDRASEVLNSINQ